jgi:hypothetical protein
MVASPEAPNSVARPFEVRFAAGEQSQALSGVWRVWCAKKKPDLFIAERPLGGEVKASIHCPRPDRPTWKRHHRFDREARGSVADDLRSAGHLAKTEHTWLGADCGLWGTLEWRIFILNTELSRAPLAVSTKVRLVPPPKSNESLVITIYVGKHDAPKGYPQASDAKTFLLEQGRLSDDRPVWITYCYVPPVPIPPPAGPHAQLFGSQSPGLATGELRCSLYAPNSDGSLAIFDIRAEIEECALK